MRENEFNKAMHAGEFLYQVQTFSKTCDGDVRTGVRIRTTRGVSVCDNNDYYPMEVDPEDMRRIVACLNFCHGMSTESLEKQVRLLGIIG